MAYPYTYDFKHLDSKSIDELMSESKNLRKAINEWSEKGKREYPKVFKHRQKKLQYINNLISNQFTKLYSFFNDGDHLGEIEIKEGATEDEILEIGMQHFFEGEPTTSDILLDWELFQEENL